MDYWKDGNFKDKIQLARETLSRRHNVGESEEGREEEDSLLLSVNACEALDFTRNQ